MAPETIEKASAMALQRRNRVLCKSIVLFYLINSSTSLSVSGGGTNVKKYVRKRQGHLIEEQDKKDAFDTKR